MRTRIGVGNAPGPCWLCLVEAMNRMGVAHPTGAKGALPLSRSPRDISGKMKGVADV